MICEWITLLRLASKRSHSAADYREFQAYQGHLIVEYLMERGIDIRNARMLDLGCGHGGYSYAWAGVGAQVISLDLRRPKVRLPNHVIADARRLPFPSCSLPIVFCASLIEHVPDPAQLLAEIERVLTMAGYLYLSFPPFYSPVGGHQFKPYHLLGERWALRLSKHKAGSFATSFGDCGLYPLTIRRVRRLIADAGLKIKHMSTRFLPLNMAAIPWLGEFLTWHVQFILCKHG